MSKAFTKDDDDAGFAPPSSLRVGIPTSAFRLTSKGARLAAERDEQVRAAVAAHAEILPRVVAPERAALGVTVIVDRDRRYRLVSAEERALLGEGCSVDGPIGRALLGAAVGDTCEVALPRGIEELEIVALEGED
jgi:transcription elongation factor GreA